MRIYSASSELISPGFGREEPLDEILERYLNLIHLLEEDRDAFYKVAKGDILEMYRHVMDKEMENMKHYFHLLLNL